MNGSEVPRETRELGTSAPTEAAPRQLSCVHWNNRFGPRGLRRARCLRLRQPNEQSQLGADGRIVAYQGEQPQRQLHPALILLESFQRAVNFGFALWRERLDEPQRTTEIDDRKRGIGHALSEAQSRRQRPL